MRKLFAALCAMTLISCALPACAAPTAEQAGLVQTIRDALAKLEALLNQPPVVVVPPPPPVATLPSTCALMVSVDKANTGDALNHFQTVALGGRKVDCGWFNFGDGSWAAQLGEINDSLANNPLLAALRKQGSNVYWTLPMLVAGTSWEAAATGAYDANWRQALQAISNYTPAGSLMYLRPAPEFTGFWFPVYVKAGDEANFARAWQRYVGIARQISPNFRFEWGPSLLYGNPCSAPQANVVSLAAVYPGDAYVDVFGADPYARKAGDAAAMITAYGNPCQNSLTSMLAMARAHGKPLVATEFGMWGGDANAAEFGVIVNFIKANGLWHSEFDRQSPVEGDFRIDAGLTPKALAAYRAAFGAQ